MGVGSGLGAQLVVGSESSYGAGATLDHSYEFDSETIAWTPQWMDDQGLHAGGEFGRDSRTTVNTFESAGSVPMDFVTNKMGLLVKNMVGSSVVTPTQISTTTAYQQVHQDGPITGLSLACQIGRPQTDGTCKPFTELGGKIVQWVLSCSAQQRLKLALDFNFQDETTATGLAAFSPVANAAPFDWKQATIKFGGTASTTSGVVSIASGTPLSTLVTGFTLTGQNPMNTARYGLGGAGAKKEPISNARRNYALALTGEFTSQSEIYDVYRAFTRVPVQLTLTGAQIGSSGHNFTVDIVIPSTKIKTAAPNVAGPDVVQQNVSLEVTDDEANARIQVTLTSSDTTL